MPSYIKEHSTICDAIDQEMFVVNIFVVGLDNHGQFAVPYSLVQVYISYYHVEKPVVK